MNQTLCTQKGLKWKNTFLWSPLRSQKSPFFSLKLATIRLSAFLIFSSNIYEILSRLLFSPGCQPSFGYKADSESLCSSNSLSLTLIPMILRNTTRRVLKLTPLLSSPLTKAQSSLTSSSSYYSGALSLGRKPNLIRTNTSYWNLSIVSGISTC